MKKNLYITIAAICFFNLTSCKSTPVTENLEEEISDTIVSSAENDVIPVEEKNESEEVLGFVYTDDNLSDLYLTPLQTLENIQNYSEQYDNPVNPDINFKSYEKTYLHDFATADQYDLPAVKADTLDPELIADMNHRDSNNATSLMNAVRAGNDWKIKALLDAGADVNAQDNDGWTALMYAVRYQSNLQVIKLLLSKNADVRAENKFGTTALYLASCYNENPEIIESLLNYYAPAEKEVQKAFILLITTQQSSEYTLLSKVRKFVKAGVPVNAYYDGKTPLMYAARYTSSTKLIKLLLDEGAKPKARSTEGKTVFEYASENKSLPHDDIYWSLNKR